MLKILNASNLRGLIKQANELEITKENIVTVHQLQGRFYLVYEEK